MIVEIRMKLLNLAVTIMGCLHDRANIGQLA